MELRQLRYFVTLSKTLNFSRAAENLYISQPTLSQQIAALEDELKVKLFYRNHRKVELTFAGKQYLEYCVQIFALLDEAREKARLAESGPDGSNTFIFGIDESTTHLDRDGFFDLMERFQEKFPNCKSTMKFMPYKSVLSALENQEIDVGVSVITSNELETIPFETTVFKEQAIVLCVPNAFYETYQTDPDLCIRRAIEELELCLLSTDQRWANNFKWMMRGIGLPFYPCYLNGYNTICTYVQAGKGTMIDIELSVTSERLTYCTPVPFPGERAKAMNVLIWNHESRHPLLREFLQLFERE